MRAPGSFRGQLGWPGEVRLPRAALKIAANLKSEFSPIEHIQPKSAQNGISQDVAINWSIHQHIIFKLRTVLFRFYFDLFTMYENYVQTFGSIRWAD